MGIPLLRGRGFTTQDRQGTQPVAIVSAQLAQLLWPDEDAIGKRSGCTERRALGAVVGIAGNVRDPHEPGVQVIGTARTITGGQRRCGENLPDGAQRRRRSACL